ncbi:hypothetical protein HS1_001851 [Candidatus Desulfofervidus auxilii]|uniref:Uncharacterized protein n=1 Tax=Desulfofervidus auxilii TaxID=1621989 RepID=A0A7U4QLP0_DESA2|nr:hypothetical protein [Candidatus Desulfofervidus auxilii]AMM41645.1 hypothetical protein HS1_001851 [Candidatus Desulfofervidus auxilii]CAD7778972.1 MAG: hypothetical protein KCCBMMGE_00768 [Candidatus Methanoperedenaceae archaeon GB37]
MKRWIKGLERLFMAATYAEAGAFESAREVLKREKKEKYVPLTKRIEQRKEIRK